MVTKLPMEMERFARGSIEEYKFRVRIFFRFSHASSPSAFICFKTLYPQRDDTPRAFVSSHGPTTYSSLEEVGFHGLDMDTVIGIVIDL